MEFEDEFEVPSPIAETWKVLTDIERVYPCLPGAELEEVSEGEFKGMVTLRLGPVTAAYRGTARFEDLDEENGRLTICAEGRDRHGQGTAKATILVRLTPQGDTSTRVAMHNNIEITGKAAQFGRGVIEDVSREIMGQFAASLREVVINPTAASAGNGGPATAAPAESAELDMFDLGRRVAIRRARESKEIVVAVLLIAIAWMFLRRKS